MSKHESKHLSFLLLNNILLYGHTHYQLPLFGSSVSTLATMINDAMNICVWVFLWMYDFNSLGHIPKNGNMEAYDNTAFNFLRHCQTVFQSDLITLLSHQQCISMPTSPHSHQHFLLSIFIIITIIIFSL